MCNIAGYVGNKPAAGILIEMMKRQEGFGGGYYTGLATVSEGKLYHAKVIGDVEQLIKETDALNFPGTIGIIHSRSKSGGGREWAHPFIGCNGKMAYVANGASGIYNTEHYKKIANEIANSLVEKGYKYEATAPNPIGRYPVLPDGTCVHMSDVMCQLISSKLDEGLNPVAAMREAFISKPSEIVGLMLHSDYPDMIFVSRINQPMMVGKGSGETFLGTTAMAFPDYVEPVNIESLPAAAVTEVFADGYRVHSGSTSVHTVAKITPSTWCMAYQCIEKALSESKEPMSINDLRKCINHLWPENEPAPWATLIYEILHDLKLQGRLKISKVLTDGVTKDIKAESFRVSF
jgi:glucosamine 6-phosphate synthetase-like amidotransferase/phosphosugar isomerase protein